MIALRVIKVGGSLLQDPRFPERAHAWTKRHPATRTLVVTGGGVWVEGLRDAAERFQLPEADCHRWAIELMGFTARLCAHLTGWPLIATLTPGRSTLDDGGDASHCMVLDSGRVFDPRAEVARGLPASWNVTSDALAAQLALFLSADELAVWKSAAAPPGPLEELAAVGYVDPIFVELAAQLPALRIVNLRGEGFPERIW